MYRGARRRPGSPKQDVEGWKANPPFREKFLYEEHMDRFFVIKSKQFVTVALLFVSAFCYAQGNLPSRIIGRIPRPDSPALYQIQVGAFLYARNVTTASNLLRSGGFEPAFENFRNLTRVIIPGIPANEIIANLERIKRLGIDEVIIREDPGCHTNLERVKKPNADQVIIREDTGGHTISEKWVISDPESRFLSFEFTQENRFIAIERADNKAYFGEYSMSAQNVINMSGLGTLRINTRNDDDISLSFSPVNEPSNMESISAVKETPMARDLGTDLFSRAWRVSDRSAGLITKDGIRSEDTIGRIYLYSINGTYLVTKTDGSVAYVSHWRWVDDSREEFLYSHDNWQTSWKTKIITINENALVFNENSDYFVEFVPAYE